MDMLKLVLLLQCVALLAVLQAPGSSLAADYCFEEAGREHSVSPLLLWSISKEESNFNPYEIHVNDNGTYDYCHMGINSWWYSKIGPGAWSALSDPCQCTKTGAWILSQCIERYGYTWKAVGCYNAKSDRKRVRYAWKIHNILSRLQNKGNNFKQ